MKVLQATCDFGAPPSNGVMPSGRADRIVQQLTGLSRSAVRGLFDHGCVNVNASPCSQPQAVVHQGDVVRVRYEPQRRYKELPKAKDDPAFDLLFEDQYLLVVNKAAHVLTVPTTTDKGKTLIAALEQYVNGGSSSKIRQRLHVVQRLDRGVSGVLVVAKSAKIAGLLREQFAAHKPQRIYVAIVSGEMQQNKGTFRTHMATGRTLQRYSTDKPSKGELAITHYEVVSVSRGATVVRVKLETGRRNQIRVHFAEAGHPVLGDRRYRTDLSAHPKWNAKRLALHAMSLEIAHPVSGKLVRFEAPTPQEFAPFCKRG